MSAKTAGTVLGADADMVAGAPTHEEEGWHQIDWHHANQNVRRLQTRIVKATQDSKWGKVKALQYLLTHSHSGKVMAVRRVTENQGKRTPGVDGVIWDTPEKKATAVYRLKRRGYTPQPLRRLYIPKSNGKKRPLGLPVCPSYCTSIQGVWGWSSGRYNPIGCSVAHGGGRRRPWR